MRPDQFPRVNDVMLAEAMRQLLPVAELGLHAVQTSDLIGPFRRAETVLFMWTRQQRGRERKLDGPLPPSPNFPPDYFIEVDAPETTQSIPPECKRQKRARKSWAVGKEMEG